MGHSGYLAAGAGADIYGCVMMGSVGRLKYRVFAAVRSFIYAVVYMWRYRKRSKGRRLLNDGLKDGI